MAWPLVAVFIRHCSGEAIRGSGTAPGLLRRHSPSKTAWTPSCLAMTIVGQCRCIRTEMAEASAHRKSSAHRMSQDISQDISQFRLRHDRRTRGRSVVDSERRMDRQHQPRRLHGLACARARQEIRRLHRAVAMVGHRHRRISGRRSGTISTSALRRRRACVLESRTMPGARWFPGARLNYAEHVLRHERPGADAVLALSETTPTDGVPWTDFAGRFAFWRRSFARLASSPATGWRRICRTSRRR